MILSYHLEKLESSSVSFFREGVVCIFARQALIKLYPWSAAAGGARGASSLFPSRVTSSAAIQFTAALLHTHVRNYQRQFLLEKVYPPHGICLPCRSRRIALWRSTRVRLVAGARGVPCGFRSRHLGSSSQGELRVHNSPSGLIPTNFSSLHSIRFDHACANPASLLLGRRSRRWTASSAKSAMS